MTTSTERSTGRIVDAEEFNARIKNLSYDGAAVLREAEELKRLSPA